MKLSPKDYVALAIWTLAAGFTISFSGCGGSKPSSGPPPGGGGGGIFQVAHTQQWVTQFGTGTRLPGLGQSELAGDTLTGIAIDPQGNVGVSASTLGSFPGFTGNPGSHDAVIKLDTNGNIVWTREFGAGSGDFLDCIASDAAGNFYVGGTTQGAFPGYSNPASNSETVAAKFDGLGNQIWLSQFSVLASDFVSAIAVDSHGNVILGGFAFSGGGTPFEIFIASIDASTGHQNWLAQFGPSNANTSIGDELTSLAVDSAGNIYVSGGTEGTFPGMPGGAGEPFVLKLNSSGVQEWVQQLQSQLSGLSTTVFSVAVGPDGNLVVGGATSTNHEIIVGQGADPSDKGLLAKLDGSTGKVLWLNQFGTGAGDEVTSIAVDPMGNIAAAGMTNGVFNSAFRQPNDDVFLLKFDSSGQNIWAQQLGNGPLTIRQGIASSSSVATDSSGDFYLGNVTQGAFPGFSNPKNAVEMFVAKFGP